MLSKLREFGEKLLCYTIWEIFKYVLGLLFTTSAIALVVAKLTKSVSFANNRAGIVCLAILGSLWLYVVLYRHISRHLPMFPRIDSDFRVIRKELSYKYLDRTHMVYSKKVKLKALRNGLDEYHDRYAWSGSGKVELRSMVSSQRLVTGDKKNVWQLYVLKFPWTLKKGETIETEVNWDLEDTRNAAVPFASATVEEPTDCLVLSVSLPAALGVAEVTCEVSSGIGAKKPFSSELRKLDRHGEMIWEIRKPKLLYHYEIKWMFDPGEPQPMVTVLSPEHDSETCGAEA